MGIEEEVFNERRKHAQTTGRGATYIYAGDKEYQDMMNSELMKLDAHYYDKKTKLIGARFFAGMKVIRVHESSHLHIC